MPKNTSEQISLLERASTAAYIAYQHSANPQDQADALAVLGRALAGRHLWRPALDALHLWSRSRLWPLCLGAQWHRAERVYAAALDSLNPNRCLSSGDAPVRVVVSVSGAPLTPEPAASNGFKIKHNYYTLDGKPVEYQQSHAERPLHGGFEDHRAAAAIRTYHGVRLSPAGLEIDNPHLVSSGDSGTLDWIEDGVDTENTEFRDNRFTAAIDRSTDSKSVFTVAHVIRAVSPGNYVLPQAYVEDMYNPSRYGRTGTGGVEVHSAK